MKKIIVLVFLVMFAATSAFAAVTIKLKRDTAANWTSNNPTLASGEIGVETDTKKTKVGDGSTGWNSLGYATDPPIATELTKATDATLTAAEVSGTMVTNYGQAAADVALTLPTAAAGYHALFNVSTAQSNKWGVRAGTNDKIHLIAAAGTVTAGSDNGYARMTAAQVGQSFACWTFKTEASAWDWACKAVSIGTSTFAAN